MAKKYLKGHTDLDLWQITLFSSLTDHLCQVWRSPTEVLRYCGHINRMNAWKHVRCSDWWRQDIKPLSLSQRCKRLKVTSMRSIFFVCAFCRGPVWWITFWLQNIDWLIQSKIHHMFMFLRKVEIHLKLDWAGQGLVSDNRSTSQWSLLQTHCWWSIVQLLQWDRPLWHLPPIPALHQQDFFSSPQSSARFCLEDIIFSHQPDHCRK